jgi:hypothetical protein
MMRAHGIPSSAASTNIKPAAGTRTKNERRDSINTAAAKKRKLIETFDEANSSVMDDEEGYFGTEMGSRSVKHEPELREQFKVEEESMKAPGQLSMHDAADLMQYYDCTSSFDTGSIAGDVVDFDASEYSGSTVGYATPCADHGHSMFSPPRQTQPYDMGLAYSQLSNGLTVPGMSSMSMSMSMRSPPKAEFQPLQPFQPTLQYPAENQGLPESPVIVE